MGVQCGGGVTGYKLGIWRDGARRGARAHARRDWCGAIGREQSAPGCWLGVGSKGSIESLWTPSSSSYSTSFFFCSAVAVAAGERAGEKVSARVVLEQSDDPF